MKKGLLWLFVLGLAAEGALPLLKGPYLGQKPPGMNPELFAPGIVSTVNHEHSRLVFSKDGTEMYWVMIPLNNDDVGKKERPFLNDKQNIYFTAMIHGEWSEPAILPLTKSMPATSLTLSSGGDKLYFRAIDFNVDPGERPRPGKMYLAGRYQGRWANPKLIESPFPVEKGKACGTFVFAQNGNIYFDCGGPDKSGEWTWKIFVSRYNNNDYAQPELLEGGINDGTMNWCPWISPDESCLIWSSHREGDFGNGDLYVSFRDSRGGWMKAINLGSKINTDGQERFPSISPDGKYLFFTRDMDNETHNDFYWVDAKAIEELRPKQK